MEMKSEKKRMEKNNKFKKEYLLMMMNIMKNSDARNWEVIVSVLRGLQVLWHQDLYLSVKNGLT